MALFRDRLEQGLALRGMTAAELSRATGIGEGAISQYRRGAYKASQSNLDKIARALSVPVSWLMGGDVPVYDGLASPSITDDVVTYPVLGDLAAGYEHIAYEDWEAENVEIPREYLKGRRPEDFFVLRVSGDSMYPQYQDGDVVLVLKQTTLNRSGEVGVVIYDDEHATLKKVEYVMGEDWMRLIPLNPQYPPVMITGEALEHCRVLGLPAVLIREIEQ